MPEISFIATNLGKLSSDGRDPDTNRIQVQEAELAIQSYVYPNVRAEVQITGEAEEDLSLGIEQVLLTNEQIARGLSGRVGKYFVPFGRTNFLHRHSWLYARRPLVLQNLVAPESLSGQGAGLSWLVPTGGKLFLQIDAGTYAGAGTEEAEELDPATDIPGANGAQFRDKFNKARVWAAYPPSAATELELGGSWVEGRGFPRVGDDDLEINPNIRMTGVDLSFRHYGKEARRLLLRAEHLWYHDSTGLNSTRGYYALADYRLSKYHEFGLLYDWSGFSALPGAHESALSGWYTRQFTEQTYLRLQLTHGDRPGKRNYNEAWLQLVWGVGPHTHQLE